MPKLADIIEINASLGYSQVKKDEKIKCNKCNGTGYVTYIKVIDNGNGNKIENIYGAICSCRQKPKYEGWKITDESHRTNYYTPYVEEIRI
jgi:predicted metal-binding protein